MRDKITKLKEELKVEILSNDAYINHYLLQLGAVLQLPDSVRLELHETSDKVRKDIRIRYGDSIRQDGYLRRRSTIH